MCMKNRNSCERWLLRSLIAISLLFLNAAHSKADNCDFNNLKFGSGQEQIKKDFGFESPDVAMEGEAKMTIGAPDVCGDLPETSVLEFMVIDDKFVQLHIVNRSSGNKLLTFATKLFGERDNSEKDPRKVNNTVKRGLWTKDTDYSVIYTTYNAGGHDFESLVINANNYKSLFDSANLKKSQDMDAYLKEHPMHNAAGVPLDNSAKNLQDLKDSYDQDSMQKNKVLKENDNSRGYHYEK